MPISPGAKVNSTHLEDLDKTWNHGRARDKRRGTLSHIGADRPGGPPRPHSLSSPPGELPLKPEVTNTGKSMHRGEHTLLVGTASAASMGNRTGFPQKLKMGPSVVAERLKFSPPIWAPVRVWAVPVSHPACGLGKQSLSSLYI